MKRFFIFLCAISLIVTVLIHAGRTGNEIRIYSNGRDIQSIIENLNFAVDADSLRFREVGRESDADLSVAFVDDIGDPQGHARSHALSGQIEIANYAPANSLSVILLHEILHCAGSGHEPNDPSSIMYIYSQSQALIHERHIRDLQRLSGITGPERLIAHLRQLF